MSKKINSRAAAAKLSWQIIDKGQSLDAVLADYFSRQELGSQKLSPQDRGLVQELVYGVCRWYGELDQIASRLLQKPIRNKDRVVHFVILVGLYQLRHLDTAAHAAVAETVAACKQLQKIWAKNLVNGCLRTYLRNNPDQADDGKSENNKILDHRLAHPAWIAEKIEAAWPEYGQDIFAANNQRPPMCLRVNRRQYSRADYLDELNKMQLEASPDPFCEDGIIMNKAVGVSLLPGFADGAVSVQDSAAQLACDFLDPQQDQWILDACAAPGGKTAHLLERTDNQINMHALDISERRCLQLRETLRRLQLNADIHIADASKPPSWPAPDNGYDRILIDAPCSDPDIKHHRRPADIEVLTQVQSALLSQLWLLLKPGGKMLYMTCSILPEENQQRVAAFLAKHSEAQLVDFSHPNAMSLDFGKQTLPGVHAMDGFYYCLLEKSA